MITSILPCLYLCTQFIHTTESVGRQYVMVCLGLVEGDCVAYPFLHVFLALRLEKAFLSRSYWLLEQGSISVHVTGSSSLADLDLPEDFLFVYTCLFFLSLPQIKAKQTKKKLSTAKISTKQKKWLSSKLTRN